MRVADAARGDQTGDGSATLMEAVLRRESVLAAYERVVHNEGAPGIDGMTVDKLMPYCRAHWARVRVELLGGSYEPQPMRRVGIRKPDGKGTRTLGIPTVMDRLIQQATLQVLQPIFAPIFSDYSFGFRPGRSAHGAVLRAQEHIASGHRWVVDLDLAKFFDRVNHHRTNRPQVDAQVAPLAPLKSRTGVLPGRASVPRSIRTSGGLL